jgi:hypothetical protein
MKSRSPYVIHVQHVPQDERTREHFNMVGAGGYLATIVPDIGESFDGVMSTRIFRAAVRRTTRQWIEMR